MVSVCKWKSYISISFLWDEQGATGRSCFDRFESYSSLLWHSIQVVLRRKSAKLLCVSSNLTCASKSSRAKCYSTCILISYKTPLEIDCLRVVFFFYLQQMYSYTYNISTTTHTNTCNSYDSTPVYLATDYRLHISLYTIPSERKKKHPATVVVVVGVLFLFGCLLGLRGRFCMRVMSLKLPRLGAVFWLLISCKGSHSFARFGLVLWLVLFGRSLGLVWIKKTIKKRLAVVGLPSFLFICLKSFLIVK